MLLRSPGSCDPAPVEQVGKPAAVQQVGGMLSAVVPQPQSQEPCTEPLLPFVSESVGQNNAESEVTMDEPVFQRY